MKILQLGKFYPIIGGIEKVMYDLTLGLSENQIKCDMLCASKDRKNHTIEINSFSNIICTSTWIKLFATMISPSMIFKLNRICKNYDIIHIHHPDPMAAVALIISGYKGKVILHWHSDILKQKLLFKFYKPLQNWLIKRADLIIGTNPKYLKESPYLQEENLNKVSIPIGIDAVPININNVEKIKKLFIGKKIIFSLGRLVDYKGYTYLIDAATYLPDDYIILIGGDGPLKDKLQQQIELQSLHNKVKLLGRISNEELNGYFHACDIYVLSSIWKTEAFGIVQIEAMSCGKPIVACNISGSGVNWVNKDGVSGLNVETENSQALAHAIKTILTDKERYMNYSKGAFDRYNELFRKEKMIKEMINVYRSIIA